ncbi:MAG: hypothetical protein ACYCZR_12350 [Burkholderiales bacterium]
MLPFAVTEQTEEKDIEKLAAIVDEAIELIASKTGLTKEATLGILEAFSIVELRSETPLSGKGLNTSQFIKALDKGVKAIAFATGLNSTEISTIFTQDKHASAIDVVYRLREKSKQNRWSLSHY